MTITYFEFIEIKICCVKNNRKIKKKRISKMKRNLSGRDPNDACLNETQLNNLKKKIKASKKQKIVLECCVCNNTNETKKLKILLKQNSNEIAKLNECQESKIDDNSIFYSCCGKHGICYDCLYKISANFDHHPIGPSQSLIPCPDPFSQPCLNEHGFPHYFT